MKKLVLMGCLGLAGWGMPGLSCSADADSSFTTLQINGHRCLVAGPKDLPKNAPVVFILHGLGANADDLFPLIPVINLPPCRFILPDAPLRVDDHSYGWYDLPTNSRTDIENSRDYLFGLMKRFSTEGEKPGQARPIILMGFSQGAVMSLEAGLNYPGQIEAIVAMSGYIWNPAKTFEHAVAPPHTPILMTHGTEDRIVPEDLTQKTLSVLQKAGYQPILKEYPLDHHISMETLEDVSRFLKKVIQPETKAAREGCLLVMSLIFPRF
jgi:phospholipase/carboxylesterase